MSSTAASLVTGRTKNVGVITPFINRWFFAEVLEGIEGALISAGYDLTLFRLPVEPEQRSRCSITSWCAREWMRSSASAWP